MHSKSRKSYRNTEDNQPASQSDSGMGETRQPFRKRRALLLRERVTVIEMYSCRPRPNYETLAKMFNCGRSQIKDILRRKGQILQEYARNPESVRVRRTVPHILIALNQIVDEWVKRALCRKAHIDDRAIYQTAVFVQQFLDYDDFEPTKSWLRSFKRRHGYYRVDLRNIEVPPDRFKSLDIRNIYQDIKSNLDSSVVTATDLKLKRENKYPSLARRQFDCDPGCIYEQILPSDDEAINEEQPVQESPIVLDSSMKEEPWIGEEEPLGESDESGMVVLQDDNHALQYLKPLEEFAMLTENFRAIGLISQLEAIFKSKIRVSEEVGRTKAG